MLTSYVLYSRLKRSIVLVVLVVSGTAALMAQQSSPVATESGGGATEVQQETAAVAAPALEIPMWKQKLYYGYNFDIYWHYDSRPARKENGWSFTIEPEIGWRVNEKCNIGMRVGGTYQNTFSTFTATALDGTTTSQDLRVRQGSWSVTPYARYRLKTLFNEKLGVWVEAHLYAGMEFPKVVQGLAAGTDYEGLRYSASYGFQVSPVITYQFNKKSNFQIFFSILSLGYSGTTYCKTDSEKGNYAEHSGDVIIFSGKLRNLLSAHFTPGMYGLKFGVQKSF